jgi:hypothetical protein
MFELFENVKAVKNISKKIKKGCEGVVVYNDHNVPNKCIVEFFDKDDETIDVLGVNNNDIEIYLL